MSLSILHRDDLPLGGFAGLREHRLVTDPKVFGKYAAEGAWPGLANFVYLADARFNPKGETHLHDHKEVDVISVMVEGRIRHEGTLEHGEEIKAPAVQVQRAGGEGFSHNEINPDDTKNRMIQIWVLPEKAGEPSAYKVYKPEPGSVTRVYGGTVGQSETFAAKTIVEVARLAKGENVAVGGPFMAYMTGGRAAAGELEVCDGDLLRGEDLELTSLEGAEIILIGTL